MARSYQSCLPREYMRAVAGFSKGGGQFFVKQAEVPVPETLQRMVWPAIDDWTERFHMACAAGQDGLLYKDGGVDNMNLAAQGFLALMTELRSIFLQDAAILFKRSPSHILWSHPVFRHADWPAFAQKVCHAEEVKEEPMDLQIQKILPVMAEQISTLKDHVLAGQQVGLKTLLQAIEKNGQELRAFIQQPLYISRSCPINLSAPPGASGPLLPAAIPVVRSSTATFSTLPATSLPEAVMPTTYVLDPNITTVTMLWREWTEGIRDQPSVQSLIDNERVNQWRKKHTAAEKMWFCRRKTIIEAIRIRATDGDFEATVNQLQFWQKQKKLTLDRMSKLLAVDAGRVNPDTLNRKKRKRSSDP